MKKTIIGSGIYNLDEIVVRDYPAWPLPRPFNERTVLEEVGGTCGNVMCILAWMGWDSRPQAHFDDTPQGLKLTSDLARYGCDVRYVANSPAGGTTLLRCVHKRDADGSPRIACRAGSPGGSRFPRRRFLRVRDEAPAFLESLEDIPDVYFFDDPAAGHRAVARALREKGALVWYEPSRVEGNAGLKAVAVSDVVKFSGENIPDSSFADAFTDKLFIQTLGKEGLRFRLRGGRWVAVPPVHVDKVVDTEGAGDWTSAAFINVLGEEGVLSVAAMDENTVARLLDSAQRTASESVGYLSSKGLISAMKTKSIEP